MKHKFEIIHTVTQEVLNSNSQWNMPYVPAIRVVAGKPLYISGVNAAPIYHSHPHQSQEFDELDFSLENQAKLTMENLKIILDSSGGTFNDIVQLFVFIVNVQKNGDRIGKIISKYFDHHICSSSKKHAYAAKEPWLIATSLCPEQYSALEIMLLYKKRMQIEETFRDLKNTRNGLGLRHCRSFTVSRLNTALLIATLAMLVLWVFGIAAKQKNLHYSFQSNTEKRRNVLSIFIVGWQVLIEDEVQFRKKELLNALGCHCFCCNLDR